MADRVNPSGIRDADPLLTAASMKHGGGDWIVTAGTDLYASYDGLAGPLQAFDVASSSASSSDVTIDTGEGFAGGAWLARDSQTTVTLASQVTDQTVYVGWRSAATNMVIIGLDADFQADDPRIPIFDFDTDGSGVISTTDRRPIGRQIDIQNKGSASKLEGSGADEVSRVVSNNIPITTIPDGQKAVTPFNVPNGHEGRVRQIFSRTFDGGGTNANIFLEDVNTTDDRDIYDKSNDGNASFVSVDSPHAVIPEGTEGVFGIYNGTGDEVDVGGTCLIAVVSI